MFIQFRVGPLAGGSTLLKDAAMWLTFPDADSDVKMVYYATNMHTRAQIDICTHYIHARARKHMRITHSRANGFNATAIFL